MADGQTANERANRSAQKVRALTGNCVPVIFGDQFPLDPNASHVYAYAKMFDA